MRPKTRFTYRKELNMKVRMYKLIQEIVDSGIESGYQYACKHTENPTLTQSSIALSGTSCRALMKPLNLTKRNHDGNKHHSSV